MKYNKDEFLTYMNNVCEHRILVSRILAEWRRRKVSLIIPSEMTTEDDNNAVTIDNIERALYLSLEISHTAKNPDFLEWLRQIYNMLLEIKYELKKIAN